MPADKHDDMQSDTGLPIIRLRIRKGAGSPGMGAAITALEEVGGFVRSLSRLPSPARHEDYLIEVSMGANGAGSAGEIARRLEQLGDIKVFVEDDPTFAAHHKGKIEIRSKAPLLQRSELARVYTPGFAHVAKAIHANPELVYDYTAKGNSVAIVTDGTSVSGLGDIGPHAAIPVMEGKSVLFREFARIDAYPICLGTKDDDEIICIVKALEAQFGAVMLEDIAAPRCFDVERRLDEVLDIPVLHDDQHGTAISAAAALLNAARLTGRDIAFLKIVVVGAGAAGTATAKLFKTLGAENIIVCDRQGALTREREGQLGHAKRWFVENTNPNQERGTLADVLKGADVFLGVSGPGTISVEDVKTMAPDPIIFALANPVPEIMPHDVADLAAIVATGRSDLPNQIDNGLCYPGIFRGALDSRATTINDEMKLAAAHALAKLVPDEVLCPTCLMPDIFDTRVVPSISAAVYSAAVKSGAAPKRGLGRGDDLPGYMKPDAAAASQKSAA